MWPFTKKEKPYTIYDLMRDCAESYYKGMKMGLGPTKPVQREIMWSCLQCDKKIMSDEPYIEIMHYRPHPGKTTHKHFHPSCFEEIAGKDYI